ncbi:MAG: TolC family protein, partial [Sphingobacteriaceae bacterium]
MYNIKLYKYAVLLGICLAAASCKVPAITQATENRSVPDSFNNNRDTANISNLQWRAFFTDKNLVNLIDTALKNNQELRITLQDIEIARNDIRLRQGQLLPTVSAHIGAGVEKVGRYTSQGAGDATTNIAPGVEFPDPLTDYTVAAAATWEADIWKKLHNAKKAAISRYLSTIEGKNFVLTGLIADVANSYYELLALDNQLEIVRQNVALQKNALEIVKIQKEATRVTELA